MNYTSVGAKVRKYRKAQGMTQEKFAERCSLSPNYIGTIERGIKMPTLDTFVRIANALGVSADMLLADELEYNYSAEGSLIARDFRALPAAGRSFVRDVAERAIEYVEGMGSF